MLDQRVPNSTWSRIRQSTLSRQFWGKPIVIELNSRFDWTPAGYWIELVELNAGATCCVPPDAALIKVTWKLMNVAICAALLPKFGPSWNGNMLGRILICIGRTPSLRMRLGSGKRVLERLLAHNRAKVAICQPCPRVEYCLNVWIFDGNKWWRRLNANQWTHLTAESFN